MKKLLLIAFLLTLSMGTAIAQGQKGGGQGSGGNSGPGNTNAGNSGSFGNPVDRLTEQLGLNEEQVAVIAAIFDENQAQRDQEREQSRLINCEIRANTHTEILGVLTPEQTLVFEELQQKREEMRQAFEEMRQAHGGGGIGGGRGMQQDCPN